MFCSILTGRARNNWRKKRRDDLSQRLYPPPNCTSWSGFVQSGARHAAEINRRMAKATDEMSHWAEYDSVIINRDLDASVEAVKAICKATAQTPPPTWPVGFCEKAYRPARNRPRQSPILGERMLLGSTRRNQSRFFQNPLAAQRFKRGAKHLATLTKSRRRHFFHIFESYIGGTVFSRR
jgi:hypothetical protein